MANALGYYNPVFYANEMMIQLEKALGLANTVFRGYDATPRQLGSTIDIKGPGKFTATDVNTGTGGTTQDIVARSAQITLDRWKEVKFGLTDKELTYTKEQIIADHITPAAYALADAIDQDLATLIKTIPWYANWSGTVAAADTLKARKILFDNKVPVRDGEPIYFMLDSDKEAALLGLQTFTEYQGAGPTGERSQVSGYLGKRYGMNFFANQNAPAFTSGTSTDLEGAINNSDGYAVGAVSLTVDGLTSSTSFKAGDILTITGDEQQYALTADVTLDASATSGTFTITPPLAAAVADNAVVTFKLPAGSGVTKTQCFAYHRNCIALAMAPLTDMGKNLGANIATVTDPVTNLSLRSRIWYDGDKSTVKVGVDALWGKTVLDYNMGCRML